jgi:AcrR family transcriptional regulator
LSPTRRSRETRAQVEALQRARMIAATIAIVEDEGYARLTVAKIISRAGVSRKAFYDIFESTEHCFLVALDQAFERAGELAQAAYASEEQWRDAMRAAVLAVLLAMEQERGIARLCVVEALGAGAAVLDRRATALEQFAGAIEEGSNVGRYAPQPLAVRAIAGGVAELLHARLLESDAPLHDLLGSLMSLIVMPYFGRMVAHEEFQTPVEAPAPHRGRAAVARAATADPMGGLNMRLTYRTVRVLNAIGEMPGASNRQIADHSGITDRGQVSKLLRRLEGLDLIENQGVDQLKGVPNAWRLTSLGERIRQASGAR